MNIFPPFLNKHYQVIYADPPWQYRHCATKSRRIENHYMTLTMEELSTLIIPADTNSVLYLWATSPKLREAILVMDRWGFNYQSSLVWDKERIGMGYWFRGQHELLLVGVRGTFKPPPPVKRIASVYRECRTQHSKKPDGIRAIIQGLFTDVNRLEMFARNYCDGWDAWGDEIT